MSTKVVLTLRLVKTRLKTWWDEWRSIYVVSIQNMREGWSTPRLLERGKARQSPGFRRVGSVLPGYGFTPNCQNKNE
jgi:hypothetical protein